MTIKKISFLLILSLFFITNQVNAATYMTISSNLGGTVEMVKDDQVKVSVEVEPGSTNSNTNFQLIAKSKNDVFLAKQLRAIPEEKTILGNYFYDLYATTSISEIYTLLKPATVIYIYQDKHIAGLDEANLTLNYWNESSLSWVSLETTVDEENNTLTAATTKLDYHTALGQEPVEEEEVIEEPEPEPELEEPEEEAAVEVTVEQLQTQIAEILAQINALQAQLSKTSFEGIPSGFAFNKNLSYGNRSDDIKYLQIILKEEIDVSIYPEDVPATGYFGLITKNAVISFQEKYASEILTPLGLERGTGYVGSSTIKKLNELL